MMYGEWGLGKSSFEQSSLALLGLVFPGLPQGTGVSVDRRKPKCPELPKTSAVDGEEVREESFKITHSSHAISAPYL